MDTVIINISELPGNVGMFITEVAETVGIKVNESVGGVKISINEVAQSLSVTVKEVLGVNGLSAYQVALQNGFVGTEVQWLNSLGGGGALVVTGETPLGMINGSNAIFTTANQFSPGSERVYINGLRVKKVDEYNTSGNTIINVSVSPNAGEMILVDYTRI